MTQIAVLVGSLRRHSINRRLARAIERLAGDRMAFREIELSALPLYNEDLWQDPPAAVSHLKESVSVAEGVLFVTPEYNRSLPAVVKNAIDWGTRPWGDNSWAKRRIAIAGASFGAVGTAVAQSHFRGIMGVLDALVMGQPEVYLNLKSEPIGEDGTISEPEIEALLRKFVDRLADWVSEDL